MLGLKGIAGLLVGAVVFGLATPPVWDVGEPANPGQLTLYNRTEGASMLGFPLAAGDVNGDGRDDLVLTPMNADSGPERQRIGAGEAVIVFSNGGLEGERDLALLDPLALPPDIAIIYGANPHDYLGTEVAVADLDGDGYADPVLAAQWGDGRDNQRANSGELAIVWGGPQLAGQVIDLNAPPPGAVTFVYGVESGDRFGVWVSAGDVDGDGAPDVIAGADLADGVDNARDRVGESFVLYGGAALRAASAIDLADTTLPFTRIVGIDPGDQSGATVRGLDVDRDGVADVMIGAGLNRLSAAVSPDGILNGPGSAGGDGPTNACAPNCNIGEAYVVYGVRGARPALIDLAAPPPSTTIIYGIDPGDAWGEELWAGDVDGDGHGDIAIGALTADGPGNSRTTAGELALIRGGAAGLRGAVIDLAHPPAGVTIFSGARRASIAGDTALMLDLDGDGRDELVIASPGDQPFGRVSAGTVDIFFGHAGDWPAAVDLATVPAELPWLQIAGATGGDQLAYSMSLGDISGDGYTDLILNAMGADGFQDRLTTAGDSYVLDAVALTRAAGREPLPICAGDCNRDRTVSIDELVRGVSLALDGSAPATCRALDRDHSSGIDVSELIGAVANALGGCPG
ncbi:MAG: hypothetical protein SF182_30460 [Deltaproteobacteria bacterium]|nr:hypothetical protein [Deltaproteobacteria bacterium]